MGFAKHDYFSRQYEKRKVEWDLERAWHDGYVAGYTRGTRDTKEAHGNQVGASGQKETQQGVQDEGVPGAVEDSYYPCSKPQGHGDACDPDRTQHIVVARFPPDFK
jgi:hypothetical protein